MMDYAYRRNERIIRSKTKEFLSVGTVVTASTYLVYVIDFMLIGKILGADAVAAAGLCDSFVDIAEFPGFVISSGGTIAAGLLLGKRQRERANGVFTMSIFLALLGGLLCCILLPFSGLFGDILTGGSGIADDVTQYIRWTIIGSPFLSLNFVISGFAILDNHSRLAMMQVVASNTVNIILDIVFMKYFGMGVAGAAAATLCGTVFGILIGCIYLFSGKRTFRFTNCFRDFRNLFRDVGASSPSFAFDKASRIFASLVVNVTLMYFAGNLGVALYAIYGRLKFILRILAGGALKTISSLGSMLYGERDFFGIRKMMSFLLKYTYIITAVLVVVLFFIPEMFLRSYGIDPTLPGEYTVLAFRLMLISIPVFWLNDLLAMFYPSIQRPKLSVLLLACQNVVFRILMLFLCMAVAVHMDFGILPAVALWCILSEVLALFVTLVWEKLRYGGNAIFGLEDPAERECHTFSITGKRENVADIHREIERFCHRNSIDKKKGVFLAIAFEEVALNIIDNSKGVDMIDICLLLEGNNLIVRVRDNGMPFNPLDYGDENDIFMINNIRLLEKITDQKSYTRIMNMNNTILSIRLEDTVNI